MQRPCERENRAGTSIETRANVSMRRNIAHITSNRNDLQKKKKRKSNSTRGLRLAKIRSLSRAKSIAPWNFEAGACMSVSACQRVARALPPPLGGFERVCWLYARDLRVYVYEVTPLFSRPRVFLRLSVRRRPFSPSEGGEERRAFRVKERSRRRGFAMRGGSRVLSSRGNA